MEILRHLQNFWDSPENYSKEADKFLRSLSNQDAVRSLENKHGISADLFSYNKKLRAMVKPLAVFSGVAFGFAMTEGNAGIALLGIGLAGLSLVYAYTPKSQSFTRESIENQVGPHWR